MQITRAAEYAVRGVLYLSMQPEGAVCLLSEISQRQQIPPSFLSKIFQNLSKAGIVTSSRGTGGGFALSKDPSEFTLLDVVQAIDGQISLNVCVTNGNACRNQPICPVHDVWCEAQQRLLELLRSRTFSELAQANRRRVEEVAREPQPSD